jgi:DNA-binding NarL/FixJ family response regulator
MTIRLLIGAPDPESIALYQALLTSALRLLPLDIVAGCACTREELTRRIAARETDVLLLDWSLTGADTPAYVRELIGHHPRLRTIITMPLHLRQYRTCLWEAGACVGLPKEHLDQEWLLSMLCLINRAMEREDRWAREPVR